MMDTNSDLMKALVKAKQEELRHSNSPFFPGHEPGTTRRWMGSMLIRIGERIGGTRRVPAPTEVSSTLAMQ
ncbi:MAG: hypothetical protein H0T93_06840 [Chloroflexia bacterium]|nr:hypothetical protein [Chloroflexia bacterium]